MMCGYSHNNGKLNKELYVDIMTTLDACDWHHHYITRTSLLSLTKLTTSKSILSNDNHLQGVGHADRAFLVILCDGDAKMTCGKGF